MLETKFQIGQVVYHTKQKYRGVIIDADSSFQPQGVNSVVLIRKNIASCYPWYRVLVDKTNHISYVKEPLLELDTNPEPIDHPKIKNYLNVNNGSYTPHYSIN